MKNLLLLLLTSLFLFSCANTNNSGENNSGEKKSIWEAIRDSYDPEPFRKIRIPLPKPSQDEN